MVGWQGPIAKVFSRLALHLQALQLQLAPGLALEPLKLTVQALNTLYTVDLYSIRWSPRTFQELKPKLRWGAFEGGEPCAFEGGDLVATASKRVLQLGPRSSALQGSRGGGDEGDCRLQHGAAALLSSRR